MTGNILGVSGDRRALPAPDRETKVGTAVAVNQPKNVAATIRRIARKDRRILRALAAFDRGERPAA
jgi:hypothetical protein